MARMVKKTLRDVANNAELGQLKIKSWDLIRKFELNQAVGRQIQAELAEVNAQINRAMANGQDELLPSAPPAPPAP